MKTRIYIDGYNLYYGVLKNSPYKWLDPIELVKSAIINSVPANILAGLDNVIITKYFTSEVIPKITFSATAATDQKAYHQALQCIYPEEMFSIILGTHTVNPVTLRQVDPLRPKELHAGCPQVNVWRIEEKQTDINIAVHALMDAFSDPTPQHFVFVSNDTDLCPLLDALKKLEHIKTGVIAPVDGIYRHQATDLARRVDWAKKEIKPEELKAAQLALRIDRSVRTELKSSIRKPLEWFGAKELSGQIFEILFVAMEKRNKVYQWLEQQPVKNAIDGVPDLPSPAIELLDDVDTAQLVLVHAQAYADYVSKNGKR